MCEKNVYTADDEEPDCGRCDNCDTDAEDFCAQSCGPEHGWYGYRRTEWDEQNLLPQIHLMKGVDS